LGGSRTFFATTSSSEENDMRHAVVLLSLGVVLGAAVACSTKSSSADDPGADAGDTTTLPPGDPNTLPPAPPGPAGTGGDTGLPCDVQAVLENRCIACHDGVQQVALLSYDNLIGPSKTDPSKTLAQLSLERMQSTTSPMPPPPAEAPNTDEVAIFQDWVNAGTPKNPNSCTDAVPTPDGGTGVDGGDAGNTAVVCTSNTTWKQGNQKSPLMNPGMACNACHQKMGGPNLAFAGTVYTALHEPDLCNGKAPPPNLSVIVTDKNGKKIPMTVNAAGNFYITAKQAGRVAAPFTAVVRDATNNTTRAMVGKVTSGDCNSCHTLQGANGAPGRIQAP
jgi:mono/diheme cytochrome c family protein